MVTKLRAHKNKRVIKCDYFYNTDTHGRPSITQNESTFGQL